MTFNLFDDPVEPPEPEKPPSPPPRPAAGPAPCPRPHRPPLEHRCRIGGGSAGYSDDDGRTWFCRVHMPPNFLPVRREP